MLKVLTNPDEFFRESEDINFVVSFVIVLISGILGALMIYANMDILKEAMLRQLSGKVPEEQARALIEAMKYMLLITPIAGAFIGWLILAALIHGVSALLGGKGDISKTFKFTAFGYIPSIVLFPITFSIVQMTRELTNVPLTIVGMASTIWQFAILTFAIKHARNLDTTRAAISVAVPIVILTTLSLMGKLFRPM